MPKVKVQPSSVEAETPAVEQVEAQTDTADRTIAAAAAVCELEMHNQQVKQLVAELKSCQAELKIHKDAWESEAEKYTALSAKADRERNEHEAVVAQLKHVIKLIRTAEAAHYEQLTTQVQFDAEGWQRLYQTLVKALMPVFTYRD